MKTSGEYTEEAISKAIDKAKGFFAIGTKQFKEKRTEGIQYGTIGMCLYCPVENMQSLNDDVIKAVEEGQAKDMEENTPEQIIIRELYNYESFYTGDREDATEALESYGFDDALIESVFQKQKAIEYAKD